MLAKLPRLEKIFFDCCDDELTDKSLRELAVIRNLRILDINFYDSKQLDGTGFTALAGLTHLEELSLQSCDLSDEGLAAISGIQSLRTLSLNWCGERITSAGLAQLNQLQSLKSLTLELGPETTDAVLEAFTALPDLRQLHLTLSLRGNRSPGLKHLATFPRLDELEISAPLIDDTEISDLPSLPRLRKLKVFFNCSNSGDRAMHHFATFPGVSELELDNLAPLSAAGVSDLVARFPHLTSLRLSAHRQGVISTQDAIGPLTSLPDLRSLSVDFAPGAADTNVCARIAELPLLEDLHIRFAPDAADIDLSHLAQCRRVRRLSISGTNAVSDTGLAALGKLTTLRKLTLWLCASFSDAGLKHLAGLKNLEELRIIVPQQGQLTEPACTNLRNSLPGCRFIYSTPPRID